MPEILGIKLSNLKSEKALEKIIAFLESGGNHLVVTPNPEIILTAQTDQEFFNILNAADLSLADGFGLKIAALLNGQRLTRVTGSDLTLKILELALKRRERVLILNWERGLSNNLEIQNILLEKYPGLRVLVLDCPRSDSLALEINTKIKDFNPSILFSALGSPEQEKIIYRHLSDWPSVRVAIGVGGSFDFLTGKIKRAPLTFRRLGLEWLWRLIQQPTRLKRIYRATFVFMFKVIKDLKQKKLIKQLAKNKQIENKNMNKKNPTAANSKNETNQAVRLRFATSPTGFLHIGNLRTALFGYLIANSLKGKFILRIEDTDQKREVPGALKKLREILTWVGIEFDEGPEIGGNYGPYIQSERVNIYQTLSTELLAKNGAYRCFCSEERLEKMRAEQEAKKLPPRYDRLCRDLSPEEVAKKIAKGEKYVIRQKLPLNGEIKVYDELRGEIKFKAEDLDDHVLIKSNGIPTYQFANIVDDHLMEISHVTRGDEWLASFPKNILLYQAFGWTPPKFIHLPLILNKTGGKLSKRQGDVFVEQFKEAGYLPEAIINFCSLLGWHPSGDKEILSFSEIKKEFSIAQMGASPAIFDLEKLDFLNGHYIRQKTLSDLTALCLPYFKDKKIKQDELEKYVALAQERMKKLADVVELTKFLFALPNYDAKLLIWKNLDYKTIKKNLSDLQAELEKIEDHSWTKNYLEEKIISWIKAKEGKNGDYLWPLRVALSGLKNSPSPFEIAAALGKTESLARINIALKK